MGIVITPESELGLELAKWEQHQTAYTAGSAPGNPYQYRPYPKMLYRAGVLSNGKGACMSPVVSPYGWPDAGAYQRACDEAEAFTRSCQKIVHDDSQERLAAGQGWCDSPQAALALYHREQEQIGTLTAERHYTDQRMSDRAKAEAAAVDADTFEQVPDIPAPKKRRGISTDS